MTKKELRKKAEQILQGALLNPHCWKTENEIKIYRAFWEGKRMALMEMLDIDKSLPHGEMLIKFPLPWEDNYPRRQNAKMEVER